MQQSGGCSRRRHLSALMRTRASAHARLDFNRAAITCKSRASFHPHSARRQGTAFANSFTPVFVPCRGRHLPTPHQDAPPPRLGCVLSRVQRSCREKLLRALPFFCGKQPMSPQNRLQRALQSDRYKLIGFYIVCRSVSLNEKFSQESHTG